MVKRAPARRRPRKAKPGTKGLTPAECRLDHEPAASAEAVEAIEKAGGWRVGSYKEPLGGHPVLLAVLPIAAVEPTPFQRDLSDAHHKRLADVINKTGRFLDPVIAIVAPEGGFWTPNGRHRLEAMRRLGAKSITALVVADREVAWQILALNTEKAHNLREKSLETIRMARALAESSREAETSFAFEFEQPAFLTLGVSYEERPRLSGGAYQSILRRVDAFLDEPIAKAVKERERRGKKILKLDEAVSAVVERLKSRGLTSPYLRSFVVARVNYTRFSKADSFDFDEALDKITGSASKFNVDRIKQEDVAKAGGGPPDEE